MSAVINRPAPAYAPAYRSTGVGAPVRPLRPTPVAPVRRVESRPRVLSVFSRRNAAVMAIAFLAIMLGRLFISVGIDSNAYQIAGLAKESQNLTRDANFIQEQLDVLNSPQHLSDVAQGLGMIANPRPAYLRISDGKKWGNAAVGIGSHIDRTQIANNLIDTLGVDAALTGVATETTPDATADSKSSMSSGSTAAASTGGSTGSTGIPAPNTH